jgi:hypothetical protein
LESGAQTTTTAEGRFELNAQTTDLKITCVGYRQFTVKLAPETTDLEIRLIPESLRRTETVQVQAGPFPAEPNLNLAGTELRNLASVLADDPLRAVQGLPGVTSNDDFSAQLSLRAAPFNRIGVYLDGILLHSPLHTVQNETGAGSLTLLSADMLDQVELHAGPIPVQFNDRTGGAIDMRYRDGDRHRHFLRAAVSASNASVSTEGPLAKGRGSWLVSLRKSYLQYLIQSASTDPTLAFGFWDVQGRLSYDLAPSHRVSLSVVQGQSGLNREGAENSLGLNAIYKTDYKFSLANAASRWTPNGRWLIQNNAALLREDFENTNRQSNPLSGGNYQEWVWNSDNSWQQGEHATLYFGANVRHLADQGFLNRITTRLEDYRRDAIRPSAHLSQEFRLANGRITLRAGGRTARNANASLGLAATAKTRLSLSFGAASQLPELSQIRNIKLNPERANHAMFSLEQRLDEKTRLRAELWHRADRDLLIRPLFDPRILNGRIYGGNILAPWANAQRLQVRGAQVFLQRRSANGLTGWVSYSYTEAPGADYEQKHTINIYSSYRLRPTVNLSARWSYGSGFPIRAYVTGNETQYRLSETRNTLRLPTYHRLDLRANKTYSRKGWQMTLYAEVVNVYNHRNIRYDDIRSVDIRTGITRLGFDKLFPILPAAGLSLEK